ncbi:peptidoglycan DD-metalloendopeptidase family protein [Nocardia sp. NPDC058176]|uniref:peptidoglycan DD-metalloendopeptidase family protein n=1 Tax=Nocardia sp. NPDC058176 TaxID=3346368 RepID=UPI0036DEF2CD
MNSTARAGAALVAAVVAMAMILVVIAGSEEEQACLPTTTQRGSSLEATDGKAMPMAPGTFSLTSGFGPRWGAEHQGQDFGAAPKVPIYAVADGLVVQAGPASGFGIWVVIDHNFGGEVVSSVYGHMFAEDLLVSAGDTVSAGQPIAAVGYNGEVLPPGPGGAHLHLEIWTGGGRFGGGSPIDPMPWLEGAETDSASPDSSPVPAPPTTAAPGDSAVAGAGTELAAMPASIGSEAGLQVDSIRVARTIVQAFPQVQTIGGQRADPLPDHPSGRAIDIMIPDPSSGEGKALGDQITQFLLANAGPLQIDYLIWRQTYYPATGEPNLMEDRGGFTVNHMDHVHVTTVGGGYPDGSPIEGSATNPPATGSTPCGPDVGESDLAPGHVPADLEHWYRQAGAICPEISSSLLAAQGQQESGFRRGLTSPSGAQGLAQFLPDTATSLASDGQPYVIDADGSGTASVWDDGDAIIGQGRYMCDIAAKVSGWISEGKVSGDVTTLTLAGYNAGEGAVLRSGGFPTGAADYETQTKPYVANILAMAAQMSETMS